MEINIVPQPRKIVFKGKWLKLDGIKNIQEFIRKEFKIPAGNFVVEKRPRKDNKNIVEIGGNKITIQGDENLCYATLIQLLKQKPGYLPEVTIIEEFKFPFRAYHLDMPRGGVPHLEYFKKLLRWLFISKYNYFALYFEDLFPWKKYPQIGAHRGRLSREEVNEIIRYGGNLGIEVFPSLELAGHMEQILAFPEFREFTEWNIPRESGTINLANPQARKFLYGLLEDAVGLFRDARYIHIGGDESWTLGRGRSFDETLKFRGPEIYELHHKNLISIVKKHKKIPIMWNDMLYGRNLPRKQRPLWKNILKNKIWDVPVMANWDYSPNEIKYFDGMLKMFEGKRQIVCPGLHNWNTLYPNFDMAFKNMKGWIGAARRYGTEKEVMGFLMTSWGDDGAECLYYYVEPLILATMEISEGNGKWEEKWLALSGEDKRVFDARIAFGNGKVSRNIKNALFRNRKLDSGTVKLWKKVLSKYKNVKLPEELELIYDLIDLGLKRHAGKDTPAQITNVCKRYIQLWLKERKKANLEVVVNKFNCLQTRHFLK